jgi:rfaE bifunctional protein nucleotidyltransferase chain/domain
VNIVSKLLSLDVLVKEIKQLVSQRKKIVFTNGCFDILHAGHVRYLEEAGALGDILIIGLNSDKSVHIIKGKNRPVITQNQRAAVLAGLGVVDFIVMFDEPDPLSLIMAIKPDVLVKGGDWPEEDIIGADFVKVRGGTVKRIPIVPDISTSGIIDEILRRFQKK